MNKKLPLYAWLLLLITYSLPVNAASSKPEVITQDSVNIDVQRMITERITSLEFFKTTAQLADVTTISVFSEVNYVSPRSWQKKPFILDAQLNTPVPIGGKWFRIPRHGIYFSILFHPDVTVRILQNDPARGDTSSPVRTPSFKPGFTFFITCNKLWNTGQGHAKHYFTIKIYHHSNGQDQPHFTPDGYWNRYNGDFSDLIIYEFGYGGLMQNPVVKEIEKSVIPGTDRTATSYNYYWKGLFSLHPPSGLTPDMTRYHIYGYYRSSAQAGFIWAPYYQDYITEPHTKAKTNVGLPVRKEIFRVYATIDYIWDTQLNTGSIYNLSRVKEYNLAKRMNASITFSARIPGTPYAGLFAQAGYYASDPYNVYFQESMLFFRVGLSVGHCCPGNLNIDK